MISEYRNSPEGGGGHTSISLTGMLVRGQISTTQKNRMTLNSNKKKIECPKIQTQRSRMTQDAMFVKVSISMKATMILCFSVVCVLHSKDSSV